MTTYSIFGSTPPPGAYTLYGDGNPSVMLGQSFTLYGTNLVGSTCVGGRVYVPSLDAHPHTSKVTIKAWLGTDLNAAPVRTKEVAVSATGWVEALWDSPLDMPSPGTPVTIGYVFTGTEFGLTRYVHTPGLRGSGASIKAPGDVGLELAAAPSTYLLLGGSQTTQSSNVGYGIDILVDSPEAPVENDPPVANAGVDRNVSSGATLTLNGSASSDPDGAIESYLWEQTSGPAVTLSGSGSNRTITAPTGPAVLTFRLTVTDSLGATSQDTVVVNVAPPAPVSTTPGGIEPFAMIEVAAMELIEALMPEATGDRIGGSLSYDATDDFYIWVGMIPGSASADETSGEWALDIDVFDSTYGQAMTRALTLEAMLLKRGGRRTPSMLIDSITGGGPSERPWEDDESAFRVGATYVFTARRRGARADVID